MIGDDQIADDWTPFMKPTSSLRRGLARIRREWRAGQYANALAHADRLRRDWPDNPQLLVLWAGLVQLQDTEDGPTLDDAKAAYQRAVELDDQSPAPLIELGHFLYAVQDDAEAASKYFDKAIDLCKRLLKEALLGQAKALAELERNAEAFACIAQSYWLQSGNGKALNGPESEAILEQLKDLSHAE